MHGIKVAHSGIARVEEAAIEGQADNDEQHAGCVSLVVEVVVRLCLLCRGHG